METSYITYILQSGLLSDGFDLLGVNMHPPFVNYET